MKEIKNIMLPMAALCLSFWLGITGTFSAKPMPPESMTWTSSTAANETVSLPITEKQRSELRQLLADAASAFAENCDIRSYGIPGTQSAVSAILSLLREDPRIIHVRQLSCSYEKLSDGSTRMTKVNFIYNLSRDEYREAQQVAESMVADLKSSSLNAAYKALLVHDRLAVLCEYDQENYKKGTVPDHSYSAYGALVKQIAVCQGYSEAYRYMLWLLNIPCELVESTQLNHTWNKVEIDGKAYYVDVTWDDPVGDRYGNVLHTNFLLSGKALYDTTGHKADDYDKTLSNTEYDTYYWQNSRTAFCYFKGRLYFIDNKAATLNRLDGTASTVLKKVNDTWVASATTYWRENYSTLGQDNDYLYYSQAHAIYRFDPIRGESSIAYQPDLSANQFFSIFGLKVYENEFFLDVFNSPSITSAIRRSYGIRYRYGNTRSVTFQDYDGTVLKTEYVEYGKSATAPSNPSREGYRFTGWDCNFSQVLSDLTVKAQYAPNTYTVTFLNENGDVLKTETVAYGNAASAPEPPKKDGMVFAGWDCDYTSIRSNLTVRARYVSESHVHQLVKVERKEPTCYQNGEAEHYLCRECSACFRDAEAKDEIIPRESLVLPATQKHIACGLWQSDTQTHWQLCREEGCGQKVVETIGTHVDENQDGFCDVCHREVGQDDPPVTSTGEGESASESGDTSTAEAPDSSQETESDRTNITAPSDDADQITGANENDRSPKSEHGTRFVLITVGGVLVAAAVIAIVVFAKKKQ